MTIQKFWNYQLDTFDINLPENICPDPKILNILQNRQ